MEHDKKVMRELAVARRRLNEKEAELTNLRESNKKLSTEKGKIAKQMTDYKKQASKFRATSAHPSHLKSASQTPLTPDPLSELDRLRSRVTELEAELGQANKEKEPEKIRQELEGDDFEVYEED